MLGTFLNFSTHILCLFFIEAIPNIFQTLQISDPPLFFSLTWWTSLPCHRENGSNHLKPKSIFYHQRYRFNQLHPDLLLSPENDVTSTCLRLILLSVLYIHLEDLTIYLFFLLCLWCPSFYSVLLIRV